MFTFVAAGWLTGWLVLLLVFVPQFSPKCAIYSAQCTEYGCEWWWWAQILQISQQEERKREKGRNIYAGKHNLHIKSCTMKANEFNFVFPKIGEFIFGFFLSFFFIQTAC